MARRREKQRSVAQSESRIDESDMLAVSLEVPDPSVGSAIVLASAQQTEDGCVVNLKASGTLDEARRAALATLCGRGEQDQRQESIDAESTVLCDGRRAACPPLALSEGDDSDEDTEAGTTVGHDGEDADEEADADEDGRCDRELTIASEVSAVEVRSASATSASSYVSPGSPMYRAVAEGSAFGPSHVEQYADSSLTGRWQSGGMSGSGSCSESGSDNASVQLFRENASRARVNRSVGSDAVSSESSTGVSDIVRASGLAQSSSVLPLSEGEDATTSTTTSSDKSSVADHSGEGRGASMMRSSMSDIEEFAVKEARRREAEKRSALVSPEAADGRGAAVSQDVHGNVFSSERGGDNVLGPLDDAATLQVSVAHSPTHSIGPVSPAAPSMVVSLPSGDLVAGAETGSDSQTIAMTPHDMSHTDLGFWQRRGSGEALGHLRPSGNSDLSFNMGSVLSRAVESDEDREEEEGSSAVHSPAAVPVGSGGGVKMNPVVGKGLSSFLQAKLKVAKPAGAPGGDAAAAGTTHKGGLFISSQLSGRLVSQAAAAGKVFASVAGNGDMDDTVETGVSAQDDSGGGDTTVGDDATTPNAESDSGDVVVGEACQANTAGPVTGMSRFGGVKADYSKLFGAAQGPKRSDPTVAEADGAAPYAAAVPSPDAADVGEGDEYDDARTTAKTSVESEASVMNEAPAMRNVEESHVEYQMSDDESSSSSSDDDTTCNGQPVPAWARRANLVPRLRRQAVEMDPEAVFGSIEIQNMVLRDVPRLFASVRVREETSAFFRPPKRA